MLYCRCRSAVERSPRQCLGTTFFVEFRSVVRGYHIYKRVRTPILSEQLSTMFHMRIAAIYHLFINSGRRLALYLERKKFHKWPGGA